MKYAMTRLAQWIWKVRLCPIRSNPLTMNASRGSDGTLDIKISVRGDRVDKAPGHSDRQSFITGQLRFDHHGGRDERSPNGNRFAPGTPSSPERGRHVYDARSAWQRAWTRRFPRERGCNEASSSWFGRPATWHGNTCPGSGSWRRGA